MLRTTQIYTFLFSYSINNSLLQLELMELSTCLQSSTFSSLRMNRHLLFSQCQTVKHLIKRIKGIALVFALLTSSLVTVSKRCAPVGTYNCIYHVDFIYINVHMIQIVQEYNTGYYCFFSTVSTNSIFLFLTLYSITLVRVTIGNLFWLVTDVGLH